MRHIVIVALAGFISASPALASMELSDKYECTDCHKLEAKAGVAKKKKEGPSYKEIAKEYKGKKDIEKQLTEAIIKGSKGKWSKTNKPEMDSNPDIPPKDAVALSKWIMTL